MKEKHRISGAALTAAALALLLLGMIVYVAAYLLRCDVTELPSFVGQPRQILRHYPSHWEARLFVPAARVEEFTTGKEVHTAGPFSLILY